jgi:hypothetical protein
VLECKGNCRSLSKKDRVLSLLGGPAECRARPQKSEALRIMIGPGVVRNGQESYPVNTVFQGFSEHPGPTILSVGIDFFEMDFI